LGTDLQIANVERAPLKLQSHQVERERERERERTSCSVFKVQLCEIAKMVIIHKIIYPSLAIYKI
jgi:hypothetical protein